MIHFIQNLRVSIFLNIVNTFVNIEKLLVLVKRENNFLSLEILNVTLDKVCYF